MKISYMGPYAPERQKEGDAGYDIRCTESDLIYGGQSMLVKTELHVAIPKGYVGILKSRSGLAVKEDIHVRAGVIDSNYRDEVGVLLANDGQLPYIFARGDRIAQMIIVRHEDVEWDEVEFLNGTEREGGYGTSGK